MSAKVTVIRNVAYDITDFLDCHPGGQHLLSLAVGRDATILYETHHARQERADEILALLPQTASLVKTGDQKFDDPLQSPLYRAIKKRVEQEILLHQRASGYVTWKNHIALAVWLLCYMWYLYHYSLTSGICLGICGAWVGVGIQHMANHGGWSRSRQWNRFCAFLNDVSCGGSSLVWRYHHQVSHHLYTNDSTADQDVFSSFPLLRLDDKQPWRPWHRYQAIYAPLLFFGLYFSVQYQDWKSFWTRQCYQVQFSGLTEQERAGFLWGKFLHYGLLVLAPILCHGNYLIFTSCLPFLAFSMSGSFILSALFIVSHNIEQVKGSVHRDWAKNQVESSANWGGSWACFFTGGLNYQIEHHLFPSLSHTLYPSIAPIVEQECLRAQVKYVRYRHFPSIFLATLKFLWSIGL